MAELYRRVLDSAMDIEAIKKHSSRDAPRLVSLTAELRAYLAKLKKEWEENPTSKRYNTVTNMGLLQGLASFTGKYGHHYDGYIFYSESLTEELHQTLESLLDRLEKVAVSTSQEEMDELQKALLAICDGMMTYAEWDFRTNAKKRCA